MDLQNNTSLYEDVKDLSMNVMWVLDFLASNYGVKGYRFIDQ